MPGSAIQARADATASTPYLAAKTAGNRLHKSVELYNLHRVGEGDRVVVVEGFFDAMKVAQAGFPVVAIMGNAAEHAKERGESAFPTELLESLQGADAVPGVKLVVSCRSYRKDLSVRNVPFVDFPLKAFIAKNLGMTGCAGAFSQDVTVCGPPTAGTGRH